jgi:hypothetical protein
MAQNRVIVTSERSEDHEDQLQETTEKIAAVNAGTTGIATLAWQTAQTAAQAAQNAVATRAPGAVNARNQAFQEMFEEEDKVIAKLQEKVDDLPGGIEGKIALALSNGFTVKDFGTINKQDFVVVDGPTSGSAKLVAKGSQDDSFHEWNDSIDNAATWRYVEPSIKATKILDGYTPGTKIYFRHRIHTRQGPGPWHETFLIIR